MPIHGREDTYKDLTLDCLSPGDTAFITSLFSGESMRRRLLDIGFVEGARVQCILRPTGGDPTAFMICGAIIALRREDSCRVACRID